MTTWSDSQRLVKSSVTSRCSTLLAVCVALFSSLSWAASDKAEKSPTPDEPTRTGYLVRVALPLTGDADTQLKRKLDRILEKLPKTGPRPVLVLQFSTSHGQSGQESQFSRTMDLAEYLVSRRLSQVQTVAYLPESIKGHAVLVALACEEIYMAPGAEIGEAGIHEEHITQQQTNVYRDIARRRKTIPEAVVLGMLDAELKVLRIEMEVSASFILASQLEEIRKQQLVKKTETIIERGQLGKFTGREARQWGFAKRLVDNREALSHALELPAGALTEDPSLADEWRSILISLDGPLDHSAVFNAKQTIKDQITQRKINFICLKIDSTGGSLQHAVELANYLVNLRPDEVRTVAYIANAARAEAAIVAMACDHVVMHPDAKLGGKGHTRMNAQDIEVFTRVIRDEIAPKKSRSWSLIAAMINPGLEVYRYTRQGQHNLQTDYFSKQEFNAKKQIVRGQWQQQELVTTAGEPLELGGNGALQLGLATATVSSFEDFKQRYSLTEDPEEVRPGWAVQLIRALAQPQLAFILLVVGFAAIYAELQMPGTGVGGFIAGVCFLLYFWSHFLSGTAEWLEVLLFIAGGVCVLLEVFVLPGFGVFGLGGGGLILLSLVLASQTFIFPQSSYELDEFQSSLSVVGGAVIGCMVLAVLMRRYLPSAPGFSRVMLNPLSSVELDQLHHRESLCDWEFLLDKRGTTTTPLALSGRALFDDEIVQVISDGDAIERGADVVVVEVRGSHVIVRAI